MLAGDFFFFRKRIFLSKQFVQLQFKESSLLARQLLAFPSGAKNGNGCHFLLKRRLTTRLFTPQTIGH